MVFIDGFAKHLIKGLIIDFELRESNDFHPLQMSSVFV